MRDEERQKPGADMGICIGSKRIVILKSEIVMFRNYDKTDWTDRKNKNWTFQTNHFCVIMNNNDNVDGCCT